MRSISAAILITLLATAACNNNAEDGRVTIAPEETFQVISGWEYTARIWEMDKKNNAYSGDWLNHRDDIINGLVETAGLNRIRLEIRSGVENPVDYCSQFFAGELSYLDYKAHFYEKINDNDDPDDANPAGFQWSCLDYYVENLLTPMRQALEARGEELYVVFTYVDFKRPALASDLSHADKPEEYAELIDNAFIYLNEKHSLTPDAFEIILEPDNTADWRGKEIAAGLLSVDRRLAKSGFTPDYIAPSTSRTFRALPYFDDFARNKEALSKLSALAYHRYDPKRARRNLPKIRARAEHNNLETAMLELTYGTIDVLIEDLTLANVAAWQQYGVPFKPISLDATGAESKQLELTNNFAPLALVFRNVRRGAVRIGAATSDPSLRAVAFRNADGRNAIFVLQKDKSEEGRRDITIDGVPAGDYRLIFADPYDTTDLKSITIDADGNATITAPGAGLLALVEIAESPSNAGAP